MRLERRRNISCVRISRWGAFVGEGEAGFAVFGGVEEAAIRVSFDAESEDEVADGDFGGAVLGDVGLQVFGVELTTSMALNERTRSSCFWLLNSKPLGSPKSGRVSTFG